MDRVVQSASDRRRHPAAAADVGSGWGRRPHEGWSLTAPERSPCASYGFHHGDNRAVRVAAERFGFVEVGRQRRHCRLDGEWVDWVTMELFADDYRGE